VSDEHSWGPLVSADRVVKVYNGGGQKSAAVRGVSLEACRGELILLLGPSGSGKTTLLTLMAGLCRPTEGRVSLFGRNLEEYGRAELQLVRARRMGFVFQTFLLLDSLTAQENVEIVLRFNGCPKAERSERALGLLRDLGIGSLAGKFPATLSQGQKQRVAVARAIANDAELILADEPTGSLETSQGIAIIRLLHALAKDRDKCVIVASHDLRLADYADRILRLEDGRVESGDVRPTYPGRL
jgi:putative ABC transport system ATP-binding protein